DNYNLKSEGVYKNNKKNGYFKEYSIDGNVENISKYIDDVIQIDAPEITTLELRTDYYPDGQKKVIGTYNKNGKPEGFRREYNQDGTIKSAKIFKSGVMIGKGIVDDGGMKNDSWKEYFETGELRGEGNYKNDRRIGKWIFYHRNGKIEQTGTYIEGEIPDGEWKWFYESGKLLKSEIFKRGLLEGLLKEYTDSGNVITEGKYQDDLKEGEWFYDMNDHKEIGSYKSGMRDGEWKHYYNNGNLSFTGNYIDGIPEGKHTWYHENGVIKEEGVYEGGRKEGEWKMYYKDGSVLITTYYKHGQIERIDGNKVNLPLVKEEE
ncbi:MAG: toxin-antitoxin system YwqK family antitoxin, partial [Bacteroidota bacterium]|nr:toxin-antitoxin system YwqK family antitoxin [Bacteroidota bacterium]